MLIMVHRKGMYFHYVMVYDVFFVLYLECDFFITFCITMDVFVCFACVVLFPFLDINN